MEIPTWFDLAHDYGVLELPDEATSSGPALELHVRPRALGPTPP